MATRASPGRGGRAGRREPGRQGAGCPLVYLAERGGPLPRGRAVEGLPDRRAEVVSRLLLRGLHEVVVPPGRGVTPRQRRDAALLRSVAIDRREVPARE